MKSTRVLSIFKRLSAALLIAPLLLGLTPAALARADPSPNLKPVIGGLLDRKGIPDASVQGTIKSLVINVPWSAIQPTQAPGTDHGGDLDTSSIDSLLATAQSNGESVRLRVTAGISAPQWLKTMDGPAMTWYDSGAVVGTLGRFWTADYNDAYVDMMTKLAAKYDTNPLIDDVTISECMTEFAEPFILQYDQKQNLAALQTAGYTVAADQQCMQNSILNHAAIWQHTRSSLAFNPYQQINDQTFLTKNETPNETYTESMMGYCRAVLSQRCILGNDSISDTRGTTAGDPYTSMYATIKSYGAPIYLQTETNSKIGDWRVALQRAVDMGADDVELPLGYLNWGLNDSGSGHGLTYYEGLLNANDAPFLPDTQAPLATLTSPTDDTTVSGIVNIAATASDNVGVDHVQLLLDGQLYGSDTSAPYTWSWDTSTLSPGQHTLSVIAYDAAGNASAPANATINVVDTQAPSTPSGLSTTSVAPQDVGLSWQASSDNVGVASYNVYRNGVSLGTTSSLTYDDSSVSPGSSYSYSVTASDAAGNTSSASNALLVNTPLPPDVTAPSVPTGLQATSVTPTEVDLSWTTSTDDTGVTQYSISRDGTVLGQSTGTTFSDPSATPGSTYNYSVTAADAAGNVSAPSNGLSVTTPIPADTTPPSMPTNMQTTNVTPTEIDLSWTASSDDTGVAYYVVSRDGTALGQTVSTSFSDMGVAAGSSYNYTVIAYDAAGNASTASTALAVSTPLPPDVTPPSVPGGLQTTLVTPYEVDLSWTASTDDRGVTGYQVYRNGLLIGTAATNSYSDITAVAGTSYDYTVAAYDAAGNNSNTSNVLILTVPLPPDVTPPLAPTGLQVMSATPTSVSLSWNATTDDRGVAGYTVWRGGTAITSTIATSYNDNSVVAGSNYSYTITAYDAAGNVSGASAGAVAAVPLPPDVTAPSVPNGLKTTIVSPSNVSLGWNASTDDRGVTGYNVYRNDSLLTHVSGTAYTDTTVVAGTAYNYTVAAYDAAGNVSGSSLVLIVSVPLPADTTPPSKPAGLKTTAVTTTQVSLSWTASTDNRGVTQYAIYRNSVKIGASATTNYSDTTVKASTTYNYTVVAYDSAGNASVASAALKVTTPTPDTQAPTKPTGVKDTITTGKVALSWTASTDNVGVSGYKIYRNGSVLASTSSTSYNDTSVKKGTKYSYYVVAYDAAGNVSAASATVSATAK